MGMRADLGGVEVAYSGLLFQAGKKIKVSEQGFIQFDRSEQAELILNLKDIINDYRISHDEIYQDSRCLYIALQKLVLILEYYDKSKDTLTFA